MSATTLEHPMLRSTETRQASAGSDPFHGAFVLADLQRNTHRQNHEPANLEKLSITDGQREEYNQMIGRPERAGELITWFGRHATAAYTALEAGNAAKLLQSDPDKIVLEIGGKSQDRSWLHTTDLDDIARSFPRQLEAVDPAIGVKVYYGARNKRLRLRILPQWSNGAFRFAVLRRRLITADVDVPGCLPVELYEERSMVIDTPLLAKVTGARERLTDIQGEFARDRAAATKSNSRLAKRVGALCEDAVLGDEELQQAISPVSSHHMMAVRRPGRATDEQAFEM